MNNSTIWINDDDVHSIFSCEQEIIFLLPQIRFLRVFYCCPDKRRECTVSQNLLSSCTFFRLLLYLPYRRTLRWYVLIARIRSILRNSGQKTSMNMSSL